MGASILVVEDEPAIQELIAFNLEQAGHKALLASNAEQALARLQQVLPDLVLVDWMLPGASGVDLLRRLRGNARTEAVPVIMLTARVDEQDKILGLDSGADDYITKPFSTRELNARVRVVLRRRSPQMLEDSIIVGDLMIDPGTHTISGAGKPISVGPTEFKLLHFFATHPERVYSRTQILDHVWGDHVFIEERTIDVHIRRLRAALHATRHDSLIETVRGSGYRFAAKKAAAALGQRAAPDAVAPTQTDAAQNPSALR